MQAMGIPLNNVVGETANFSIAQTDAGKVFNVTTGTSAIAATITPAATSLPSGWTVYIRKDDTATGTVADGSATWKISNAGHIEQITSNGTKFIYRAFYGAFDAAGNLTITAPSVNFVTTGKTQSNGVPIATTGANTFTAMQTLPQTAMETGPQNAIFYVLSESRNAHTTGDGNPGTRDGEGLQNNPPTRLHQLPFAANTIMLNASQSGSGVMTQLFDYDNSSVTLTGGSCTNGSLVITGFSSTTGVATGMTAGGPGLAPGFTVASTTSTTVTLKDASGQGRTCTANLTGTWNFVTPISFGASSGAAGVPLYPNFGNGAMPTAHQMSPAVQTATYTCTVTSGNNVVTLNTGSWSIPVGSTVTSTHLGTVTVTKASSAINVLGGGTNNYIQVSGTASASSSTEAVTIVPWGLLYIETADNDVQQTLILYCQYYKRAGYLCAAGRHISRPGAG